MTAKRIILHGMRFRDARARPVTARLLMRLPNEHWRADINPSGCLRAGDRVRFGEPSESTVCLLSFLDAEVIWAEDDSAVLAFAFCGPALSEALDRFGAAEDDVSGA